MAEIRRGSVKDIEVLKPPRNREPGVGKFIFTDRYSVFDYGVMPERIEGKGASLCLISAYFFEKLGDAGISTHYEGLVENGKVRNLEEIEEPCNVMQVKLVRVMKPRFAEGRYVYHFPKDLANFLIPLEFIYRNYLPEESSVFRRIRSGEITPEELGLKAVPKPGERLEKPLLDVSTKFEERDRYVPWNEAAELAGLDDEEVEEIKSTVERVNGMVTKRAEEKGMIHEDGKVELAFDGRRELMVADAVGTPDECRFKYKGVSVSKELLRKYYRQTEWYGKVERAKKIAELRGEKNWKKYCEAPPELAPGVKELASKIYQAMANEITGRKFFDVPSLGKVVREYEKLYSG